MLTKPPKPKFDADNPWGDDVLGRQRTAEKIKALLTTIDGSFVASVHSPYGTGKTFFIRRLHQELHNDGFNSFYFNAWETDLSEDPLLAFAAYFTSQLQSLGITKRSQSVRGVIRGLGAYLSRKSIPFAVRLATSGLIDIEDAAKATGLRKEDLDKTIQFMENVAEGAIEHCDAAEDNVRRTKGHLIDLSNEINKHSNGDGPIFIFVDELDRCRPSYTVQFLESIKHVFDVGNYVFVLSIDRNQLESAIYAAFGPKIDVDGYLRRFVDWSFALPLPASDSFIEFLFKKQDIIGAFGELSDAKDQAQGMCECFQAIANIYKPSLRAIEQGVTQINGCLRILGPRQARFGPAVGILIGLKLGDIQLYHAFLEGSQNSEAVIDKLGGDSFIREHSFLAAWILLVGANSENELVTKLKNIENSINRRSENSEHQSSAQDTQMRCYSRALEIYRSISFQFAMTQERMANYLADVLEFAEKSIR